MVDDNKSAIGYKKYKKHEITLEFSPPNSSKIFKFKDGSKISTSQDVYRASFWIVNNKPSLIITAIKNDPWILISDPVVQCSIMLLQTASEHSSEKFSKRAIEVLKAAKLEAFISRKSTRNFSHTRIKLYDFYPYVLKEEVDTYKFKLKPYLKHYYSDRNSKSDDIRKAFKKIFKVDMPDKLIYGERDKDLTSISLCLIAYEHDLKSTKNPDDYAYPALKKIYFSGKQAATIKEILQQTRPVTFKS